MNKNRTNILALLLVFALFLMPMSPAFAADPEGPYSVTLSNQAVDEEGEFIQGAVYTITQTEGRYNQETNAYEEATLPAFDVTLGSTEGEFPDGVSVTLLEDGAKTRIALPAGSYTIQQKEAAPGYNVDPQEIRIQLPKTNETGDGFENDLDVNPKMTDIRKSLELTKVDPANENAVLAGAVFRVERSTDSTDGTDGTFTPYGEEAGYTTDAEGKIRLDNLPYGWYRLQEMQAPDGFMLSDEVYTIHVTEESDDLITITAENFSEPTIEKEITQKNNTTAEDPYDVAHSTIYNYELRVNTPLDLKEYKNFVITDTLDDRLAFSDTSEANLTIVDQEQNDIKNLFTVQVEGQTLTVTANEMPNEAFDGVTSLVVSFEAVIRDTTTAGEIIENRFDLNYTNKWDYDGEKESNPVFVRAPENSIVLTKVDGTDETVTLEGVQFQLWLGESNAEDSVKVGEVRTTGADGTITWEKLHNGTYYLEEIQTLEGYRLLEKPVEVELANDTDAAIVSNVTVKNYKDNILIPDTGTLGALPFIAIGAGFLAISKKLKKKEQ